MAMAEPPHGSGRASGDRRPAIDILRGLAIGGMVLFHLDWDLAYWGWRDLGPGDSPAWIWFGHAVAATFLFVSGFCLVLARGRGTAAALRRIALLAGTAILITAVTRWLFPDAFIFFGIIHCIAASNLIGLVFVRAPLLATAAAGCLAALTPRLVSSTSFEGAPWWWLGLSTSVPPTLDYRPLLPWLAVVLFGVAAARLWRPEPRQHPTVRWLSGFAWAGRHSLPIYVVHQPMLFGLFMLLAVVHPKGIHDERAAFGRQCRAQCLAAGAGRAGCDAACLCVLNRMSSRIEPRSGAEPPSRADLQAAGEACLGLGPTEP